MRVHYGQSWGSAGRLSTILSGRYQQKIMALSSPGRCRRESIPGVEDVGIISLRRRLLLCVRCGSHSDGELVGEVGNDIYAKIRKLGSHLQSVAKWVSLAGATISRSNGKSTRLQGTITRGKQTQT